MNLESKLLYILVQSNQTTAKELKKLESEKVIILLGMFVVTLCFGILPIRILFLSRPSTQGNEDTTQAQIHRHKYNTRWKTIIGFANCFSGGVFVAACLLDLFPGRRSLKIAAHHNPMEIPCQQNLSVIFLHLYLLQMFVRLLTKYSMK